MRDRSLPSSLVDDSIREHEHRLHGVLRPVYSLFIFFLFFSPFVSPSPPPFFSFSLSFANRPHWTRQAESRAKLTNITRVEIVRRVLYIIYCCVTKSLLCIIDQCQLCRQQLALIILLIDRAIWYLDDCFRAFTKTRTS